MNRWWLLPMLALAGGCDSNDDVMGPFTGEVRRFVVTEIRLPLTKEEVKAMAGDLDGNGVVDNQLGTVLGALASQNNLTTHGADMIRSGAIASSVELQADDLANDDTVGVRYLGADGADAVVVGGRLVDGVFHPNRLATAAHPGRARVRLPVFIDADPSDVTLAGLEIDLVPDAGGTYLATLRGVVAPADAHAATVRGLTQLIDANPAGHPSMIELFDGNPPGNQDGIVTPEEIERAPFLQSLLAPDLELPRLGGAMLSFAFQVVLAPCAEGRCLADPPASPCHDRVRDGDEADVDCGGSCPLACAGAQACMAPDDCQSGLCGGGVCAPASCIDGRFNGLESDRDCGGDCGGCGLGRRCRIDADCASGRCGTTLTCVPP